MNRTAKWLPNITHNRIINTASIDLQHDWNKNLHKKQQKLEEEEKKKDFALFWWIKKKIQRQ